MPYSFDDIKKKLSKLWFKIVRQKWSHVIFSDWYKTFPVPKHGSRDISPWVEKKIIENIWISKKDFQELK